MENERQFGAARNTSAQPTTAQSASVDAPIPVGSSLAQPFTQAQPRAQSHLRRTIIIALAAVVLLVLGIVAYFSQNRQSGTQNSSYGIIKLPLESLASSSGSLLNNAKSLKVNGQLQVASSIALAPASIPTNPQAGQIYYDQTANQLAYYNGKDFTYLNGGGSSTTNNNFTTNVTNGGSTTNITNIIAGGGGGVGAVNGAAGALALFSDASTLTSSLLTQSGNVLTTGASLQVQGGGNNLLNVNAGGNSASLGSTGSSTTASTVHIADATGAAQTVTVGSGASGSTTTINGGRVTLAPNGGAGGGVLVKPQSDSTVALQVQTAGGTNLIAVDSTNQAVSLGTGAGTSLGYTSIGPFNGGSSGTGTISGQKVTTTAGGTITSMSAYIGTNTAPNNLFQFAIYADSGGGTAPGSYIASSAVGTLSSAGRSWYTLPITATLSPATTYWLVYWQNYVPVGGTNTTFTYSPGAGGSLTVGGSATWQAGPNNGMPATFPSVTSSASSIASLYASFATSGPALTINQFGGSVYSGAVLVQDPTDSSVAFQVQNSIGSSLLTADTSTMTVTVKSLVVTANLTVNGHVITGGNTPAIAAGAAACTSPTVSIAGNDTSGTITINTGTGCSSSGTLATITFASAFGTAPHVVLTPGSPISQTLGAYVDDSTISTTAFDLGTNATPLSSQTFKWNYWVAQ